MGRTFVRFIAIAAIVTIAIGGCGSVAPRAAPSTAPSTAPTPPTEFAWSFNGTLPSGWIEEDGTFSKSANAFMEVLTDRSVMASDCAMGPQPGVGRTALEIVGALANREGLATAGQAAVVVGGLSGRRIDIALAQDWEGRCPWWEEPTAIVPLVGTFDEKNRWLFNAVTQGEHFRYVVLDLPAGGNVLIAIAALEPEQLDGVATSAMDIVDQLEFVTPS